MGIIPDAELAAIRGVTDSALPDWLTIQTASRADDGGGDYTIAWTDARRVRGRVGMPINLSREQAEQIRRDAVTDAMIWVVTLPWDDPVTTRDRIVTADGRILNVVTTDRARSLQLHVRCLCVEER